MTKDLALMTSRRFAPLFASQFMGALNDNVMKTAIAILLLFGGADGGLGGALAGTLATALFVLPYVLFAATAGRLADRFAKSTVARWVKTAEVPVMTLASVGIAMHSAPLMLLSVFLAGCQATFFSPVKYALLPELLAGEEIVAGNAFIESGTFLAILTGTILGGSLVAMEGGAALVAIVMPAISLIGAVAIMAVPRTFLQDKTLRIGLPGWRSARQLMAALDERRVTRIAGLGLSWFWMSGAVLLAQIPAYAKTVLGAGESAPTLLLAILSIGIALGSVAYNAIRGSAWKGVAVPTGFLIMGAGIATLLIPGALDGADTLGGFLATGGGWIAMIGVGAASFGGGFATLPLYVALQEGSAEQERARTVAANNLLNALWMAVGTGAAAAILGGSQALGFSDADALRAVLGISAIVTAFAALPLCLMLPDATLATIGRLLLWVYRVELKGLENLEQAGERAVLAPNHVTWIDGALLAAALPTRPLFPVNTDTAKKWWVRWAVELIDALPLDPTKPMAIKALVKEVRKGKHCVIFPEGRLTRTGALMKIYGGPSLVADKADAKLLPVRIEGAEHTIWSVTGGMFRRHWFPKITITILPPTTLSIDPELVGLKRRQALGTALHDVMSDAAFATFPCERTVFEAFLDAGKAHGAKRVIVEDPQAGAMSYGRLTVASLALGRRIARRTMTGENVGVLLPNAVGTVATFFGILAYGRVPAMLNFATGPANMLAACTAAGIKTVLTSRRFVESARLQPAIEQLGAATRIVYLEDLKTEIGLIAKVRAMIEAKFGLHRAGDPNDPAVVLFTSGSEGTPKGVVLSHRNLLANAGQSAARIDFHPKDIVFNALPVFHSFGLAGGLLLPVLNGIRTYLYPSPLHYKLVPELCYQSNATILFGTDTFLAGYAKVAHPYDFYSVRYVFAGAERVRAETRRVWADKFGLRILEGYGATETSPVLAINTPMYSREGTVGRFLPGVEWRLFPAPGIERGGRLHVRGPNVMLGYLRVEAPERLEAPVDGWYDTGDIVEVGADGFVTILGRAKRFAKIGGEMVSLTAVEDWAGALWPQSQIAAVALPDARKGERIVLVTDCQTATRPDFAGFLRARGLPEIATPSEVVVVDKVPLLGTGKTDYAAARQLAELRALSVA
jgi:acyl-[acyl-carrier-protein]-phospholipid O-acyltransferase/long-chain-fatty-acid--[acyl-carrier-protein] ligase